MKRRAILPLFVILVLFAQNGYGYKEYFGPDDNMPYGGWSMAVQDLVRTDTRVLGLFGIPIVNTWIYCAGGTAELNAFLKDYAKVPDGKLKVVLHPGSQTCRYPRLAFDADGNRIGDEIQIFDVDWLLRVEHDGSYSDSSSDISKKFRATVEIWLGGQVELDKLDVPPNIHVESSGEIESFIDSHNEKRKREAGDPS